MKVAVLGAGGFVGSAVARALRTKSGVALTEVTRANYGNVAGRHHDVVIDASCNSKKYLADRNPVEEFALSVGHRLRTLHDFPADLSVHVSSVDVYSDLESLEATQEDAAIDLGRVSHYGMHKLLAEQLVQHYAPRWLIVRLAGMVGPGLRKNPVFDIVNGQSIRIHPDSAYQFMHTADVADAMWRLVERDAVGQIFNVCGLGLISPREIATLAGRNLDASLAGPESQPRIVNVNTAKNQKLMALPETRASIIRYLGESAL